DRRQSVRRGLHRRHRRGPDARRRVRGGTRSPHDPHRASRLQNRLRNRAGREELDRAQTLRAAAGDAVRARRGAVVSLSLLMALSPAPGRAQSIQNATLRRAQQAYDNLEYRQALSLGQAALRERLAGTERARAYELVGFSYAALDSILKSVDAFKQVVLIDPERQLDPNRVSPKAYSAFDVALRQVLLVRQLRIDSTGFVAGQGAVP